MRYDLAALTAGVISQGHLQRRFSRQVTAAPIQARHPVLHSKMFVESLRPSTFDTIRAHGFPSPEYSMVLAQPAFIVELAPLLCGHYGAIAISPDQPWKYIAASGNVSVQFDVLHAVAINSVLQHVAIETKATHSDTHDGVLWMLRRLQAVSEVAVTYCDNSVQPSPKWMSALLATLALTYSDALVRHRPFPDKTYVKAHDRDDLRILASMLLSKCQESATPGAPLSVVLPTTHGIDYRIGCVAEVDHETEEFSAHGVVESLEWPEWTKEAAGSFIPWVPAP